MLQKQPVAINFTQGLDLKTDPFQVQAGKFLAMANSVFTTAGRLTKRSGFTTLIPVPSANYTTLTTFNGNLVATGSNLAAYNPDIGLSTPTSNWLNQGNIQPIQLKTLPLIRVSTSQTSPDSKIASNGLICLVYIDNGQAYYQISDSNTGQKIVGRTALPGSATCPRVFVLGNYFVVTFLATVTGTTHLQYVAIPVNNPSTPKAVTNFATNAASLSAAYDGLVIGNNLYIGYSATSSTIDIAYLTSSLAVSTSTTVASATATVSYMSVANDATSSVIFLSWWDTSSTYVAGFNYSLVQIMARTTSGGGSSINELTSTANNGVVSLFYQVTQDYTGGSVRSDFIGMTTVTLPVSGTGAGTVGAHTTIIRSVGLASKAFIASNGLTYMLVTYGPTATSNQPSYFLIDSSGNTYMRLAYSNGGGYYQTQVLPSVTAINSTYSVAYLNNDFLAPVNKGTNLPSGTPTSAIYTQTGVNLASFNIDNQQYSAEIASTLNLTGGLLWEYDGVKPVENGFNVWPENITATTSTTGGNIGAGTYFYQFTYEWTNNQGNLERSAPSIPIGVVTTGSTSTNTFLVPTLRITYKTGNNPVRIVGYRWSVAQQVYYQFTSLTSPTINNTTIDQVTITDTLADSSILGNVILYTTGGVIENIAAPASTGISLFDNRLWLIDAEDQNLLWFSKQVIENVPVEMSDLLTLYVAPTTSAQGSTGTLTALYPMDDKLILFKKDAIYYINGTGPDNTGAQNGYSQPIFITASVGCANPNSIVLIPSGLMFQSDKGIWLLGRDLSTNYIGAPVESYNSQIVLSATNVPGTTQARFILGDNVTLMYDYFFNQWGTHTNIAAISSTLYQGKHTYLNSYQQVYQETPGTYTDGSEPVLMSLTTSWINVAGLQGFERFYFANLLGTYITPFKLSVGLAYNYNPSFTQAISVTPDNYTPAWGGMAQWGSDSWGASAGVNSSNANVFSARLFPNMQKCESFQVTIQEIYDPSFGVPAGEGLSLSGLALIVGMKRGFRTQSARRSYG